jgi:hypothetical protein
MSDSVQIGNSLHDLNALMQLRDSDGWKIVVAKFDERFKGLTDRVLDHKTDAVEAEHLRQARGRIAQEFAPQTLLNDLLSKLEAKANQQLIRQKSSST